MPTTNGPPPINKLPPELCSDIPWLTLNDKSIEEVSLVNTNGLAASPSETIWNLSTSDPAVARKSLLSTKRPHAVV